MKKKLTTFFLLTALIASMLVGCGEKQTAEPTQQQDETNAAGQTTTKTDTSPAATPEPAPTADTDTEKKYQEAMLAYEAVMEQNCSVIYNGISSEGEYQLVATGVMETSSMERGELLQYLGYTFMDISGDGVPELLIGSIPKENAEVPEVQLIFGGYTCKDGEAVCFLEGWARNVYEWMGGGRFFNYGSGGWAYSGFGTFQISEDGTELKCEDWYYSDIKDDANSEIGYYHNNTGDWSKDAGEELDIGSDDFWELSNKYDADIKLLELTPFADYTYTGFIAQPLDCKVRVDYFDDVNYQNYYDDASEYMDAGVEYDTKVLFRTDEGVADFKLLSLSLRDVDADGKAIFDITEVFNIPGLRAGIPLAVPMSFPGDIPSNGFSYTDTDGTTKAFCIGVSGFDGSLVVSPIE